MLDTHLPTTVNFVADTVTIISFPLLFLSIFAAFRQLKSQSDISRKEITFNGLMKFSDAYREISLYRSKIREMFETEDKTLNERRARSYLSMYWLNVYHEFEFFSASLMPFDTFLTWTLHAYSFIAGEQEFGYFDRDGNAVILNSRDHFENRILGSSYSTSARFYEFLESLHKLAAEKYPDGIVPKANRRTEITQFMKAFMRKHAITAI